MADTAELELVVSRLVNAPRALVFEAMTNPKHVGHWWGPFGFKNTIHEMQVAPGGRWRLTMHGPDGTDFPTLIEYREVVKNERLVFHLGTGQAGDARVDVVVTLADEGGKTRLTLKQTHPTVEAANAAKKYAIEGGHQTFTRLDAYVDTMRERLDPAMLEGTDASTESDFVHARAFAAPRKLVYAAMTEAEHLARWFGPAGMALRVVEADIRVGGMFRYGMKAGSNEVFGRLVYRELRPVDRFAYVVSFTDEQGIPTRHPMSKTWPLEVLAVNCLAEYAGKTVLMGRSMPLRATAEERDTFRAGHSGMVHGLDGAYAQLDAYLRSLQ